MYSAESPWKSGLYIVGLGVMVGHDVVGATVGTPKHTPSTVAGAPPSAFTALPSAIFHVISEGYSPEETVMV